MGVADSLLTGTNFLRFYVLKPDTAVGTLLQDKVGPFARSAADAAVVLDTVRGQDPADPSSFDADLQDPFSLNVQSLTVGVLPNTPSVVRLHWAA